MNDTEHRGEPRRARRPKRAPNGLSKPKHKTRKGRPYLVFTHPVPLWAYERFPDVKLPKELEKWVTPDRETDGRAWQITTHKAIENGTWVPDKVKQRAHHVETVTFAQYAAQWLATRTTRQGLPIKDSTRDEYRNSLDGYLLPYFGAMPMRAITPAIVQEWYTGFKPLRAEADTHARRQHVYKLLRAIMASAATQPWDENGEPLIARNPCLIGVGKHKRKHVPIRPTTQQLNALLELLPAYAALAVVVMNETGLREGEALALRPCDIDFDKGVLSVNRTVARVRDVKTGKRVTVYQTPKTESSNRDVPMSDIVAQRLRARIDNLHIGDDAPIFTQPRTGEQANEQNLRNAFALARVRVPGLQGLQLHDLRRDFCSRVVETGGTLADAMKLAGHADMSVASLYQVPDMERERGVVQNMTRAWDTPQPRAPQEPQDAIPDEPAETETETETGLALAALADTLSVLDAPQRAAMVKRMDKALGSRVLNLLDSAMREETLRELL